MLIKDLIKQDSISPTEILINASDKIEIKLILKSGLVVPDYTLNQPVRKPEPKIKLSVKQLILLPGSFSHLSKEGLTIQLELLPDKVQLSSSIIRIETTKRTINIEAEDEVLMLLVKLFKSDLSLEEAEDLDFNFSGIISQLFEYGVLIYKKGARSQISHEWSKRGARALAKISAEEVERLTFSDHEFMKPLQSLKMKALQPLPEDSLSKCLRKRRSMLNYNSGSISFNSLSQILGYSCGITGKMKSGDQSLELRAYPSPGALYAVDAYVFPIMVKGLDSGVYRYNSSKHQLEQTSDKKFNPRDFCLPDVRYVADGIAAFIALSIRLPRAIEKYGDESYRILSAEAGCMAENLILVSHAVGLRAAPFTGVFDDLVDKAIGLGPKKAQFVLGVLIGRE